MLLEIEKLKQYRSEVMLISKVSISINELNVNLTVELA